VSRSPNVAIGCQKSPLIVGNPPDNSANRKDGEVGKVDFIVSGSGDLVKDNQVSECGTAIGSFLSDNGSAFIHNYVANSNRGLSLSDADYYQGNV
jgi:hypothetical protein